MDRWKTDDLCHQSFDPSSISAAPTSCTSHLSLTNSLPDFRQGPELEAKNPLAARKVQKADREKLRRDRLNEHFLELGNAIDAERPKNDKATILGDTIQVLKDLSAEVGKLKAEYKALTEESRELTQEKNELREEKASLKSEVENLNSQYQQRMRVMYPWGSVDPSIVMAPTYSYPIPIPIPVPPSPIPMHPGPIPMQPYSFFGNQNAGPIPNPSSTFIAYPNPNNHQTDPTSTQCGSTSRVSSKHDSKSKSSDNCKGRNCDKSDYSNDVATELELKTPGSTLHKDKSVGERKSKHVHNKEKSSVDGSSLSRRLSSQGCNDSSSNSIGGPER